MNGRLRAAGALLIALAAFGCGSNDGSLAGYWPEGQPSDAMLITDVQPVSASDSTQVVVDGLIFDDSPLDGFRLFVDPAGAGFRPAADYIPQPTHTFSTGWSLFNIPSHIYDASGLNDYVGRGARHGIESSSAPLTNHSYLPATPEVLSLLRRVDVPLIAPADSALVDSLPTLTWTPTPNAARYLLRIDGRNGIVYLALTSATTHQVEISPALRLEDIPLRSGLLYRWEVQAIDSANRIFGKTIATRALLVE
jgi:hypothetical protein